MIDDIVVECLYYLYEINRLVQGYQGAGAWADGNSGETGVIDACEALAMLV
jgi:hypothetical protein